MNAQFPLQQLRPALFDLPAIESLIARREDQWFERKSFRVTAADLGNAMIGFANADGGRIVIGIHDGKLEGVNSNPRHMNELMSAALNFCDPPVRHEANLIECK